MARAKVQRNLSVDLETVAGDGGTFGGTEKTMTVIEAPSINGNQFTDVPNESVTNTGGSSGQTKGVSMAQDDAASFDAYVEGLGVAAGDGVAPTITCLGRLMASWAQQPAAQMVAPTPPAAPTWFTTGSTVEPVGGTTTTNVVIKAADADFFELPTAASIGFAGFTIAGVGVVWRPYVFDTATNSLNLLIALPSVPADASVVYGCINYPRAESWDSALPYPVASRWIGDKTEHNVAFPGSIFDLSVGETGPKDVPRYSITSKAFTHEDNLVAPRIFPTNNLSVVAKSAEVLIAQVGDTTLLSTCQFRAAIEFGGPIDLDECMNDVNDYGVSGGSRTDSPPAITLTMGREIAPPAAITAATWKDAKESNDVAANNVHVFVMFGGAAGRTALYYLPNARAETWTPSEVNKLGYQAVKFVAANGQFIPFGALTSELTCMAGQG